MMARHASYERLAEIIRHRFLAPKATLQELYGRLVFNILCGNTDDHARNHAAFWDGAHLRLTPAYDICPQVRTGQTAGQGMLIKDANNLSQLMVCLQAASQFHLNFREAEDIILGQISTIRSRWDSVCDEADLPEIDRRYLWGQQFLNPFAFYDAPLRVRASAE
jgi:serine/threonine-protein kinase HipA